MSLFDNKPLTAEEVAAREVCECGSTRAVHFKLMALSGGFMDANDDPDRDDCSVCDCEEFTRRT